MTRRLPAFAPEEIAAAAAAAAERWRAGGVVAFPTETVYGLGADATNPAAVARIFAAKGRPPTNPLIVHVPDAAAARAWAADWPDAAERLAAALWPGPLTIVVRAAPGLAPAALAGGATVGLRVPRHPVAQALLAAVALPIAAPSANLSEGISPTRAEHVSALLVGRVGLLVDAGPCEIGLESTVVDATVRPPRVLRPGGIPRSTLTALLDLKSGADLSADGALPDDSALRSPGLGLRHYAPQRPLTALPAEAAARSVAAARARGEAVGWLACGMGDGHPDTIALPPDAAGYARGLYAALHDLDRPPLAAIIATLPPAGDDWQAIHDRLRRATSR